MFPATTILPFQKEIKCTITSQILQYMYLQRHENEDLLNAEWVAGWLSDMLIELLTDRVAD